MGKSGLLWIGICALLLLQMVNVGVLGWGNEGHYSVCKIAEGYLSEEASAAVKDLLPDSAEGYLANVCTWPDDIRRDPAYRWSASLHFVNTPDFKCNYDYCRDCHDSFGHKDVCAPAAIYNYTNQLKSFYQQPKYNLTEALMFLSHIIGDVHQPMHCGFIGDLGGNRIALTWYNETTNLHRVWDDKIIESAVKTFYGSDLTVMIQSIQKNITNVWANDISSWERCEYNETVCPNKYASESISGACKYAYRNATSGSTLGDDYFLSRLPVVEERLAQAGIRLAATLNRIFASPVKIAEA